MMLTKLFPKEKDFFPIFNQMTRGLSASISELLDLIFVGGAKLIGRMYRDVFCFSAKGVA